MAVLLNLFSHLCNKFEDLVIITNKEYESGILRGLSSERPTASSTSPATSLNWCPLDGVLQQWTVNWKIRQLFDYHSNYDTESGGQTESGLISFHPHLFLCLHFNYENASFICGCNQVNVIYIFLCISLWYPVLYLLMQIKFPNGIIKFDLTYQAQTTSPSSNGLKA